VTICASTDRLIFAESEFWIAACLTAAAFLGGISLLPFLSCGFERVLRTKADFCLRPLVFPWTIEKLSLNSNTDWYPQIVW